jgi:hypothetical protein
MTRRRFLQAAAAALAWCAAPIPLRPTAKADVGGDPALVATLEAFSDTLIPGEKRSLEDRAIAGADVGAGAVQAGAIELMCSPAAGLAGFLPLLASVLNYEAETRFAASSGITDDLAVPPFVSLDFEQRTALLVELFDRPGPLNSLLFALSAVVFLSYHTAGHLLTADALRDGHPGLAAIGFPEPDPDGLWRFPVFSYRRRLARKHRRSRRGNPP